VKEITGSLKVDPKILLTLDMLSELKKVKGLVLSEETKRDLVDKKLSKFPDLNDPKLAEVYFPSDE
jgi:hypothetical protein